MSLSATVRARVDESLKFEAENILHEIGLNTSQAINIFLKKVVAEHGIPFELKVPSARLKLAMDEAKNNDGAYHDDVDDMMRDLKS
ncbi:MAG: type II toxin-antitoxin system RelB/DinJ family antitoxin [Campylobacterales bacterium]|nr:type II toxin-antitoxin system RelB/DinJ family antitoxin [Campylobacterales bacterium]